MYAHIAKGYTVGHTMTRRLLRTITCIPGVILDGIIAIFWVPEYASYWKEAGILYADGTRVGVFRGLFGWIGEIIGYPIGAFLGTAIGFSCYIPDGIIRAMSWTYRNILDGVDAFATMVGTHSRCDAFSPFNPPVNYLQKAWNVSVGTLGLVLGGSLYGAAKSIEWFLPIGNTLSNLSWALGGYVGGIIGSLISLLIYPIKKITSKLCDLYDAFREVVHFGVAFIYVQTNQEPANKIDDCCCPAETIHSDQFRGKVNEIKQMTTATLVFGKLKQIEIPSNPPILEAPSATVIAAPTHFITQSAFAPTAIDQIYPLNEEVTQGLRSKA